MELRDSFDRVADLYHRARPEYPSQLFDDLIERTGLQRGDRVCEVGCATGKATLALAARGFRITSVELGGELARAARANLASYPDVEVVQAAFETWEPSAHFDLVCAATAWHWIEPAVRYRKAWDALRPSGHLAFWGATHVIPDGGDPFFVEIQPVYEEIGEGLPPGVEWTRPGELSDNRAEIEASGLFDDIDVRQYDWETVHDAATYIDLLNTFSGHIAMEQWQRDRLYGEIRERLAARPDGLLRRHWGAVLHIARRID